MNREPSSAPVSSTPPPAISPGSACCISATGCGTVVASLPEGWVDAARRPISVEPDSFTWYGRHWWVYPCNHGSFRASGYEGQAIVVVPGLDLVIVRLGKTPFENGADPLFSHLAELIACFE